MRGHPTSLKEVWLQAAPVPCPRKAGCCCTDEEEQGEQPLTKRQRKRAKQAEEERVRAAEQRQLAHPAPQSTLEFERLVRNTAVLACVQFHRKVAD